MTRLLAFSALLSLAGTLPSFSSGLTANLKKAQLVSKTAGSAAFVSKFESRSKRNHDVLVLWAEEGGAAVSAPPVNFIDTELRGAAMRLHTKKQAPKEGQVEETEPAEPYVTTHMDYLHFLVDSQHVYQAFEDIVNEREEMAKFRNTGLERAIPLETDIEFMVKEYNLVRPPVGKVGKEYAEAIRRMGKDGAIPELMCHYYNHYFAHTAGGRMIGKQMSALLLNKKILEFYKWDGNINKIKQAVKNDIEEMADRWSREEKDECVEGTADAFRFGGALNAYLKESR